MDKEASTAPAIKIISAPMLEAAQSLAENLAQSEPFLRYKAAADKYNLDAEAGRLVAELSDLQQSIRSRQYNGGISERDLKRLRELQMAARLNATILEYNASQAEAIEFLREVNQEISQLVGIDFASLTRRSSGCC